MPKKVHKSISREARRARSANAAKASEAAKDAREEARERVRAELTAGGIPDTAVSEARLMAAKAEVAELNAAERRGELIAVGKARADVVDKLVTVRTRILAVPSRVAQRLPKLAGEIVPVLEDLLREALTDLADGREFEVEVGGESELDGDGDQPR